MSTSLTQIKSQIAKLEKQAAAIEAGIITRIKAEIAKHGLTAEQLFGSSSAAGNSRMTVKPKTVSNGGASRPAKFVDEAGNSWGGMGKRPQWIREALEAGKSLDDFLVTGKKTTAAKARPSMKAVTPKKTKAARKVAPKNRPTAKNAASVKAADASTIVKQPKKAAAQQSAAKKPAKARAAAAALEPARPHAA